MKEMSRGEHAAALFVIAMYYWYTEDFLNARNAMNVCIAVADHPVAHDAE